MENYTFDLQRIFLGEDVPALFFGEIALRTAILFLYMLLMFRLLGQRGVGQLSFFELALVIALGSAAGDPMFYPDVPLLHGMVVITVIMLLHSGIVMLTNRHPEAEKIVEGSMYRLVVDGEFDEASIEKAALSRNEVAMALRHHGIANVGVVQRAYWEIDGKVSVFKFPAGQEKHGESLLPAEE